MKKIIRYRLQLNLPDSTTSNVEMLLYHLTRIKKENLFFTGKWPDIKLSSTNGEKNQFTCNILI